MHAPSHRAVISLVTSALLLSACQSAPIRAVPKAVDANTSRAGELYAVARQPRPGLSSDVVTIEDDVYLGKTGVKLRHGEPLPSSVTLTYNTRGEPVDLRTVALAIAEATRIPVVVDGGKADQDQAAGIPSLTLPPAGGTPPGSRGGPSLDGLPPALGGDAPVTGGPFPAIGQDQRHSFAFSGRLADLLEQVGNRYDVGWEYRAGTIYIFSSLVKTFEIAALPTSSDFTASLTSGSSSAGGGAGGGAAGGVGGGTVNSSSSQSLSSRASLNYWNEIDAQLKVMVGKEGTVNASPSTGQVTVATTPALMRRVEDYVTRVNASLNQQVAITVTAYSVSLNTRDQYGLDISATFDALGKEFSLVGPTAALEGNVGRLTGNILDNDDPDFVAQALSTLGDVSIVEEATLTTLNNQPAPLQIATQTAYVQQVSREESGDDGDRTFTITPGSVTTGLILNFLPRIQEDGDVLLQYGIQLSELAELETFTPDPTDPSAGSVQLPVVNTKNFLQTASLRSGETLVLTGYEGNQARDQRSGVGHPNFFLLGGSADADARRNIVVIAIRPSILKR
jgi:type IVB pilus formation R64 PilN family outer membrane protein